MSGGQGGKVLQQSMVNDSSNIDFAERLESLKAGILAAISALLVFSLVTLINRWALAPQFPQLSSFQTGSLELTLIASGSVAAFAGFLFGVTYRYIVRCDTNSHLKSGAVLAFGLVRGLAQLDVGLNFQGTLLPFAVLALESLLLFAFARLVLDQALQQGWVKPFGAPRA